jgi:hypothetical protein
MTTLTEEKQDRVLNLQDRCDKCNAQAFVLIKFISGELMFCGHHFNDMELGLRESSYEIIDEREFINKTSESSN